MIRFSFKEVKAAFFDRATVVKSVDKATRRVLSRFGAFVRRRAQNLIRTKKGSSSPGQPPHSHTGLLKRFIFFAYDKLTKSVVIGPVKIRDNSEAPRLLEHGGNTTNELGQRLHYEPRPFMGPAFERELKELPPEWRDSIR